ncbi:zf-HC2 domain-containing protein [Glaciimonas immobilis]|uniref:zf-HC2 domain-containing protein n=1 Tax=Glaciimonas immobilis TaxID=728004 RepID=UPI00143C3D3B|nr:zf-HC2 domain-containing protein [Glaciimonas immobilis]
MPRQRLFPTCRETQSLLSEAQDHTLPPLHRARVKVHLWTCTACSRFSRQIHLIRDAMRQLGKD